MVKLSLKKVKFIKYLLLLLSLLILFAIEGNQSLNKPNQSQSAWLRQSSGQLLVGLQNGKEKPFASHINAPAYFKAESLSQLRIHDTELKFAPDTTIENLILNEHTYHGKLKTGNLFVSSFNMPASFSIQTENFIFYPQGKTQFQISENAIKVELGAVIMYQFNKKGKLQRSLAITRGQGFNNPTKMQVEKATSQRLNTFLQYKSRQRVIPELSKGKNWLVFNNNKAIEHSLNEIRTELTQLSQAKQIDIIQLQQIIGAHTSKAEFELIWQDYGQTLIRAILKDGSEEAMQPLLDFLLDKEFKNLNQPSQKYLIISYLDQLNKLRLNKLKSRYQAGQGRLVHAIDIYKENNDYEFNHNLILILNSMLKNQAYWSKNLFEARSLLFRQNLELKTKHKQLYQTDFSKQNEVFINALLQNPGQIKQARAIADLLILDIDSKKRINYIEDIVSL